MKTDLFQSCGHCWVFQICWHIECSTFTASSFRIWNSSTGIPSPPLALFVVMLSESLVAQRLKCLPPMRETWVWFLGWEDPLEKEMVTHSGILAWKIPWTEKPGRLQSMGSQRVRHDWATSLFYGPLDFTFQDVWLWMSDHIIMIIWVVKIFFVQFFHVFLPPLLNIFCRRLKIT